MATPLSDYEKLRLDNIKRNDEFMKSLGLDDLKPRKPPGRPQKRKRLEVTKEKSPLVETSTRRSLRIAEIPIPNYDLDAAGIVDDDEDESSSSKFVRSQAAAPRKKTSGEREPPAADSSRALNAQLDRLMGSEIGTFMADVSTGKAAIMSIANGGKPPRFSKYSGVVEWNNCVFLWVNIASGGDYKNSFSEKGRFMTWFGGSKMTEDTPVTQRLLRAGKEEKALLFVRLPNEPYCCLGQVSPRSSNLQRHPVEMDFELLDCERLRKQEQFKRILSAAEKN